MMLPWGQEVSALATNPPLPVQPASQEQRKGTKLLKPSRVQTPKALPHSSDKAVRVGTALQCSLRQFVPGNALPLAQVPLTLRQPSPLPVCSSPFSPCSVLTLYWKRRSHPLQEACLDLPGRGEHFLELRSSLL